MTVDSLQQQTVRIERCSVVRRLLPTAPCMGYPDLTIEKPKLRQGRSYALKTSMLESALREASAACPVQLTYWEPLSGDSILQAFYWLANANVPVDRLYVRAGTVASADRRLATAELSRSGLPAFTRWLRGVLSLPRNSPALHGKPFFEALFEDGTLRIRATPQG